MSLSDCQLDHASEMAYTIQDRANINAVWASLIVEECFRLGLTVSFIPDLTCLYSAASA